MTMKLFHPSVALAYYTGLLVLLFTYTHPVYRAFIAAGVIILAVCCIGGKALWRTLRFLLPLGLAFALVNPLLVRRGATILFYLFGNPVTLEAAAFGVNQSLLILSTVILFISFNKIIDQGSFLYLTARYIPKTALVISMALNSMARFKTRAAALLDIQKTRELSVSSEVSIRLKLKAGLKLLNLFTIRSLEEGMEMAVVLKARDYGAARRTAYRIYSFGLRDTFYLTVLTAILLILLINIQTYDFYPVMRVISFSFAKIPFMVFVFFPLWAGILYGR
jgi:energy-coupling factor transport system permease protein